MLHESRDSEGSEAEVGTGAKKAEGTDTCQTKGIICSTWKQIKQEAVLEGREKANQFETLGDSWQNDKKERKSPTIRIFQLQKHSEINCRPFCRGEVIQHPEAVMDHTTGCGREPGPELGALPPAPQTRDHFPSAWKKV